MLRVRDDSPPQKASSVSSNNSLTGFFFRVNTKDGRPYDVGVELTVTGRLFQIGDVVTEVARTPMVRRRVPPNPTTSEDAIEQQNRMLCAPM